MDAITPPDTWPGLPGWTSGADTLGVPRFLDRVRSVLTHVPGHPSVHLKPHSSHHGPHLWKSPRGRGQGTPHVLIVLWGLPTPRPGALPPYLFGVYGP